MQVLSSMLEAEVKKQLPTIKYEASHWTIRWQGGCMENSCKITCLLASSPRDRSIEATKGVGVNT